MHFIKLFLYITLLFIVSGCSVEDGSVTQVDSIITTETTDAETIDTNTTLDINSTQDDTNATQDDTNTTTTQEPYQVTKVSIPTVVIIMNWTDYAETNATLWYNKFFNHSTKSVNQWYDEAIGGEYELIPVEESSGSSNDGIIMVDMGITHPGGGDDTTFRDTHISNAIQNTEVVDNMDFTLYDKNNDNILTNKEIQIIFIVAGGEESFGDPQANSIWAHAWSYDSSSTLKVDNMLVMRTDANSSLSGKYARFGANHGTHSATIGIIVHEMGHSLFNLGDYYDNGGGSGLGWYDVMSGGSWAYQQSDSFSGETPTQFSVFNKIDSNFDLNVTEINSSKEITIKCASRDYIKLLTPRTNEYFLVECRDTATSNSDISLNQADNSFTQNKLFMMTYHIDTNKTDNTQDGTQTDTNHYKVSLIEKDTTTLMTSTVNIYADYNDVYLVGDAINTSATFLYDGTSTNYAVEVLSEDTTLRNMTIKITK